MNSHSPFKPDFSRARQAGVSLIIVLIMLVIIGLTSASAIRNATSGEKVTNNIRLQNLAQQYAEAALRYCETQIALADASRVNTLKNANVFNSDAAGQPIATNYPAGGWLLTQTWLGGGGASASKTLVPQLQIESTDSSFKPKKLPECVAEIQQLPDTNRAYVITARGFSPDYTADSTTGNTTSGSVVWLQSILNIQ